MEIPDTLNATYVKQFSTWFSNKIQNEQLEEAQNQLLLLREKHPSVPWISNNLIQIYNKKRLFWNAASEWENISRLGWHVPPGLPSQMLSAVEKGYVELGEICVSVKPDIDILNDEVRYALANGNYESDERHGVDGLLTPTDRVLECGVGSGYIACVIQKKFPGISYLGIEANGDLKNYITANKKLNGVEFDVEYAGVVPSREKTFTINRSDNFLATCIEESSHSDTEYPLKDKVIFAELLKQFSPTFLLMDIEGLEYEVLINADLAGVEKIVLEVHTGAVSHQKLSELLISLLQQGFCLDFDLGSLNVWCLKRSKLQLKYT